MAFVVPERGICESDASPGNRAWTVYIRGERRLRIEVSNDNATDDVLIFLWQFLCAHDQHLRLLQ